MATVKSFLKTIIYSVIGLPFVVNAQTALMQPSVKTPMQGEGYFRYDIYQANANVKPFLTCVTENNCPQRTAKTLAVPTQSAPKAEMIEKLSDVKQSYKNRVYFNFAASKLDKVERNRLKAIARSLKNQKIIHLRAYTDPVGGIDSIYNKALARNRAIQVLKYLKKLGVHGQINTEFNPPCCIQQGVTATSSDEERKNMRVVEIS